MHLKAHSVWTEVTDTATVLEAMTLSPQSSYVIQHSSEVVEYTQEKAHYTLRGTISSVVTQYSMMVGEYPLGAALCGSVETPVSDQTQGCTKVEGYTD